MTDRIPLDAMTSDQLDALYEQLEKAEQETTATATASAHLTSLVLDRAERAEAAVARVRKAVDSVQAAGRGHTPTSPYDKGVAAAVEWVTTRVLEAIDARLVNGGAPAQSGPAAAQPVVSVHGARDLTAAALAAEAIRQMDADPHGVKAGLVVQPYREYGQEKWVFRCWGTDDGCDGWLSLDHSSQQSAERARDRHVAEEHTDQPKEQPDA